MTSPAECDRATDAPTPRAVTVKVCGDAAPPGAEQVMVSPFQSKSLGHAPASVVNVRSVEVTTIVPVDVVPTHVPPVTVRVPSTAENRP